MRRAIQEEETVRITVEVPAELRDEFQAQHEWGELSVVVRDALRDAIDADADEELDRLREDMRQLESELDSVMGRKAGIERRLDEIADRVDELTEMR